MEGRKAVICARLNGNAGCLRMLCKEGRVIYRQSSRRWQG